MQHAAWLLLGLRVQSALLPNRAAMSRPRVTHPTLLSCHRYVDQLVAEGKAYPCFCTDEELEAMKKEAEVRRMGTEGRPSFRWRLRGT